MKTLEYTEEEINKYNFFSAWHTDDKAWVKARQKKWKVIKSKLDQLHRFIGVDKERYKSYKSYFMTGYSEAITEEEIKDWKYNKQPLCILGLGPTALFAFWLSPDHSQENWNRIKCASVYSVIRNNDERHGQWDWYKEASSLFRKSAYCYEQIESYSIKSRTAERCRLSPYYNCDSIFDGLEEFLFNNLPVELNKDGSLDTINYGDPGGGDVSMYFCYLRGDEFNPHNPRRYFVDDFIKWGFITDRPQNPHDDSRAQLVAMAWHIVANPVDYHPLQVEVARKIKAGIMAVKDQLPDVTLDYFKRGVSMFEGGIKKSFYKKYPHAFKGFYYDVMIKKLGLKFWEI